LTGENNIDDIKSILNDINLDKIKAKISTVNVNPSSASDKLYISEISSFG